MSSSYPGDLSSAIEMEAEDLKSGASGANLRSDLADLKRDLDALLGKASTLTDRELRRNSSSRGLTWQATMQRKSRCRQWPSLPASACCSAR
jgi:hypothetical protein